MNGLRHLRRPVSYTHLQSENATIFGYFFLPDVNLAGVKITDRDVRAYIPKNGYAAMQELDYCMQIETNGGKFVQYLSLIHILILGNGFI